MEKNLKRTDIYCNIYIYVCTYIYISESVSCILKTKMTLLIKYISIKLKIIIIKISFSEK